MATRKPKPHGGMSTRSKGNALRVRSAKERIESTEHRLEAARAEAFGAMNGVERSMEVAAERRPPLRRLVARCRRAALALERVEAEACWLVEMRDELARARAGRPPITTRKQLRLPT
jgi:hypothetical protein